MTISNQNGPTTKEKRFDIRLLEGLKHETAAEGNQKRRKRAIIEMNSGK